MPQLHDKIELKRAEAGPISYKQFNFDVKEPEINGRIVTGYLAVFGNKDSDGDILIKGCFAKSLQERGVNSTGGNRIAHLWQHMMNEPLGKYIKLQEDDFGLYFEAEYDDIPQANRALTQFKSGTLRQFSIGFCYDWEKMEYDVAQDAFICKEIHLFEGSVVTLSANDQATFSGMKSEQRVNLIEDISLELEDLFKGIKGVKQYQLRQLTSKLLTLAKTKPIADQKESLKSQQVEKKAKRFSKLTALNK